MYNGLRPIYDDDDYHNYYEEREDLHDRDSEDEDDNSIENIEYMLFNFMHSNSDVYISNKQPNIYFWILVNIVTEMITNSTFDKNYFDLLSDNNHNDVFKPCIDLKIGSTLFDFTNYQSSIFCPTNSIYLSDKNDHEDSYNIYKDIIKNESRFMSIQSIQIIKHNIIEFDIHLIKSQKLRCFKISDISYVYNISILKCVLNDKRLEIINIFDTYFSGIDKYILNINNDNLRELHIMCLGQNYNHLLKFDLNCKKLKSLILFLEKFVICGIPCLDDKCKISLPQKHDIQDGICEKYDVIIV